MKVGVLGSGTVAQTLAAGLMKHGHEVMIGTRQPDRMAPWLQQHAQAQTGSVAQAAAFGDIAILAVKGDAGHKVLASAEGALDGKVVIDTTNPLTDAAPDQGVLGYFTTHDESLMEQYQKAFPSIRLVKAFNSVGANRMVNPHFEDGQPTMFICGDDASAKDTITPLLTQFGWDVADMGGVKAARAIEPLCVLWCIPGFLRNEWGHAFKLLRR